jgi:hypothetical protein
MKTFQPNPKIANIVTTITIHVIKPIVKHGLKYILKIIDPISI